MKETKLRNEALLLLVFGLIFNLCFICLIKDEFERIKKDFERIHLHPNEKFEVKRSLKKISDVMNWAQEGIDQGTRYPGMSYEQGILDVLMWLEGTSEHNPMDH